MPTDLKKAGFIHYERVYTVMKSDNALNKQLGAERVAVCRNDNTYEDFPVQVAQVIDEIASRGLDVSSMGKSDIISVAHHRLIEQTITLPMTTSDTNQQPVKRGRGRPPKVVSNASAVSEAPPVKRGRGRPRKNILVEKVTPMPVSTTMPQVKRGRGRPPKQVSAAVPDSSSLPVKRGRGRPPKLNPVELSASTGNVQAPSARKIQSSETSVSGKNGLAGTVYVRQFVPYVMGVAALSNLQAVQTLLEPYIAAGDTDAVEVCEKVNTLIDDIHRRIILPDNEKRSVG